MKILTRSTLVTMGKALFIALIIAPQALVAQCVYVDFTYAIGANGQVTFTDVSGINNPRSRTWSFGDGAINTSNIANPTHSYNIANATTPTVCFDVTLTVNAGGNTGVSQPKQVCIPTSTQSGGTSLFVKILSPTPLYDGECNSDFTKIFTNQSTAFEASVLGGTPPYTYKWSFPTNTANRTPAGQGPHAVTFTSATTGTCSPDLVSVAVTDAQGVTGSALIKISVRNENEGPGAIKVVASKTPICVNEDITFKAKIDNPFALNYNYLNVSVAATYKFIVDGVSIDYGPINRMTQRFTAGSHTVGLEITDGGTIYRATPTTFDVTATCTPPLPIANFELKVGGVPNGVITINPNNSLCTDGTPANSITVKVPNPATPSAFVPPSDANPTKTDCLPNYFFFIEIITTDGKTRMFNNPCAGGYADLNLGRSNIISEEQLQAFGKERFGNPDYYIKTVAGGFKEFTLPICFAACGPLVGCNGLKITVGRYNASTRKSGGNYPTDPNGREHVCACAFPRPLDGYPNASYSPNCTPRVTFPLKGRVATLSSVSCAIKVTDIYPPLSISGITTEKFKCGDPNYFFNVKDLINGKNPISGGIPFELSPTNNFVDCGQGYKNIIWKAYYFNNPNREITGNFINIVANTDNKKASVDANHTYFNSFAAGEQRLFIVEASVADWDGNIAKYSTLVAFDAPLKFTLPDRITRCKGDNITLINVPAVQGGTATTANPYRYEWTSTTAVFKTATNTTSLTSTESNPILNLSGVGASATSVALTLKVTDANGCFIEKNTTLQFAQTLTKPTLANTQLTACVNSSSVLIIGPTNPNCSQNNLGTCLGGSGEYIFRWTAETLSDLDYLSDPTIAYPKVNGIAADRYFTPAKYTLTVTDLYGGCSAVQSQSPVSVAGQETFFNVDLGVDKFLCPNTAITLSARTTTDDGPGKPPRELTTGFNYKWESTAPNFSTTTTTNQLVLNSLPAGSIYTYKVTSIDIRSSCSKTDEIVVNTKKAWTYRGYETVIAPLLAGNQGTLWATASNRIFVNNTNGSGAVADLKYTLPTLPQVTVSPPTNNGGSVIGSFLPTGNNPNAKIVMTDAYGRGCSKEFVSNTYYLLSSNPNVIVSTDKQVVCSNGEINLYLKLNTNILTGHKYLPTSFETPFNVKITYPTSNGGWGYGSTVRTGNVEFILTNADAGVYTAIASIKMSSVNATTQLAFLIDGGLPNSSELGGKFTVVHQFNASPSSANIRLEYRLSDAIRDPYPRQVAVNLVVLGPTMLVGGNAYAEFAASKVGEVRLENDVRVLEGTRYFHAFIDPCLLPIGKFKNDDSEENPAFTSVKTSPSQEAKGAFSVRPSPFASTITLDYEVRTEKGSNVSLSVYNGIGQIVDRIFDNRFHNLGVFSTTYDTDKLKSGIYLFELTIDGEKIVKKSMKVD